jgi:transposase
MSVPGIGPLISTDIVAAIGTGAFERGRDFAAWLGLVPRQHSTGGRTILGRISKRGSQYLRALAEAVAEARAEELKRLATGPRAARAVRSVRVKWYSRHGCERSPRPWSTARCSQ